MFLQREMGPRGHIKGNTQLFRQNDFIWTKNQTLYYLSLTVRVRAFVCFFRKRHQNAEATGI